MKRRFGFIPMMALIVASIFTSLGLTASAASAQTAKTVTAYAATKCLTLSWDRSKTAPNPGGSWVVQNMAMVLRVPKSRDTMSWSTNFGWVITQPGILLKHVDGKIDIPPPNLVGGYNSFGDDAITTPWQSASIR